MGTKSRRSSGILASRLLQTSQAPDRGVYRGYSWIINANVKGGPEVYVTKDGHRICTVRNVPEAHKAIDSLLD